MAESLKLIFRLLYQPVEAMSAILDRGSLLSASLFVIAVTFGLQSAASHWIRLPFYSALLALALAYVPGLLLLCTIFGRVGGFAVSFQRDYSPLLASVALAWCAANLPLVIAWWFAPPEVWLVLAAVAYLYFAVLVFFAVRTVFGAGNGASVAVVCLSWIPLAAAIFLWIPLRFLMRWIASPFFLFYAWYYLGSEFSKLGGVMRNRQHFRRMLELSTLNPHDAEAQYQLGLIYQQRRNYSEAVQRFHNAVRIDNHETDAHFQLGRIARQQGRLDDALQQFQIVLDQDPKHSQSEILREIGALYLTANRFEPARAELAEYAAHREYDTEGLYYYGQALEGLGRRDEARAVYQRAVDAARSAPRFRRPFVARWSRLAQKQERKLAHT